MKRLGVVLFFGLLLTGCPTPPTPLEKASEAAREMNMSARWGMMTTAISKTAAKEQPAYLKRHEKWHSEIRLVDTELAGIVMTSPLTATVQVDVSWTLEKNTTLRVTRVEQKWENGKSGWSMIEEKRIGGAIGLFGEEVEIAAEGKDQHFPTKIIQGE